MSIRWSGLVLSSEYPCRRWSFQLDTYRRYKHASRPWYQPYCQFFRRGLSHLRLPVGKWIRIDHSGQITYLECKRYRSQGHLDWWMKLLLFSQYGHPRYGIADLRTSLIFCAFEATMSRDWINRTQVGESLLESLFDSDSIIFVIWLREYNDSSCRSRVGGGPAEKMTVAATFRHRVIFADTCDLTGL